MKTDEWTDFKNEVNHFLKKQEKKLSAEIVDEQSLNKSWHIINEAIKQAANNNIPKAKTSPKTHYAFSRKATKLHTALQKTNLIIRQMKTMVSLDTTMLQTINKNIDTINSLTDIQLPKLNQIVVSDIKQDNYIQQLQHQQKTIYQACKIENNLAHRQCITDSIAK